MKNDDEPVLDGFTFTLTRKELRKLKAEAWSAGWGAGYTDRHREHIGDDGYVVRIEVTPNPYKDDS